MLGFGKEKDEAAATASAPVRPAVVRKPAARLEMTGDLARLPWPEPRPSIAANHAVINLRDGLLKALKDERGVHIESLLVVIGSLAGFCALHAVAHKGLPVAAAQGADGKTYFFGDSINGFLFGDGGTPLNIWSLIAAPARRDGRGDHLPDVREIARHVAQTVGGPDFGQVRAPKGHEPRLQPLETLRLLWPRTREVLGFTGHAGAQGKALEVEHWPAICAVVAQQYIDMGKAQFDVALAAGLAMEAATITAKVDLRQPL